jgi:hypothetical protein
VRRSHLLVLGACLLQGTAWFLPVFGSKPGWFAFFLASVAFWPHAGGLFSKWYEALLPAASVGTNLLFVVGTPWALLRGSRLLRRRFAWAAASAFLVNGYWYIRGAQSLGIGLGIGYFLWWWSFLLLAAGLFDLAGPSDAAYSVQR